MDNGKCFLQNCYLCLELDTAKDDKMAYTLFQLENICLI